MQPAPFNYDVPVDELYGRWEKLYLSGNPSLPKAEDLEPYKNDFDFYRQEHPQEMFDYLDKYVSSDNPAHKMFALYVLCFPDKNLL
jgi:hypothetical protein